MTSPYVGMAIYWYPKGVKHDDTIPRIGFAQQVHPGDIIDACILPAQDGAVEYKGNIFPKGHSKLTDERGNLSRASAERGFWEPIEPPKASKKKAE